MSGFAVLLLSCGAWTVFCGYESFRPVPLARAVLANPAGAGTTIAGATAAVAKSKNATVQASTSPDPQATAETAVSDPSSNQSYAFSLFSTYGWNSSQQGYLVELWNRESGWSATAKNASSGAYGIPQALPASKMATAGADYLTNAHTQIKWGLGYIASRYGNPQKAWAHEVSAGWY